MAIPLSFVGTPYQQELVLQHMPTLFGICLLAVAVSRFQPSTTAFVCCVAFLWLHLIGARWIYSFVPYDDVAMALTGSTLSEQFGWERNHYDRLVHFASGLLGLPPIAEFLQCFGSVPSRWAVGLAVACVLAIGAVYEVLEWQIAITLSPSAAEAYNGQQGDVWDPQKDLLMALLGSLVCLPFALVQRAFFPRDCG